MAAAKRKSIAKLSALRWGCSFLPVLFASWIAWSPAAIRHLLSADQFDLYRPGHGVGVFHIAPNPAPK